MTLLKVVQLCRSSPINVSRRPGGVKPPGVVSQLAGVRAHPDGRVIRASPWRAAKARRRKFSPSAWKGLATLPGGIDYDRIAKDYARDRDASPRVIAAIMNGLSDRPVRDILEVGCGTADHLHILSQAFKATGYGFDRSAAMLEEAGKKNPGLSLSQGDAALSYPYPADRFDLVFSVNVIHYIRIGDLDRCFVEALRVLRPGGAAVTVTDSWDDIRRRTMTHYFPETAEAEFARYHDRPAIERAMTDAGFIDVRATHTEHEFTLGPEDVAKYRRKAFSALRLISDEAFRRGLARLEADAARGGAVASELYTYIWDASRDPGPSRPRRRRNAGHA